MRSLQANQKPGDHIYETIVKPRFGHRVGSSRAPDRHPVQTTTTNAAGTTDTTTTTTETTGTVTEFSPARHSCSVVEIMAPVRCRFAGVTLVTPDGRVIEASKVRKDSKVRVHYIKEGGDMVVDKVIVND